MYTTVSLLLKRSTLYRRSLTGCNVVVHSVVWYDKNATYYFSFLVPVWKLVVVCGGWSCILMMQMQELLRFQKRTLQGFLVS